MSQPIKGVPKFGSFKPKAASQIFKDLEPENQEPSRNERSRHRRRSCSHDKHRSTRKISRSREQDRHGRHTKRNDYESRLSNSKTRNLSPNPGIAIEEFEESDLFIVDRRGDEKNLEYGGLHRYDIPAHHRYGYGRILGAARGAKINREASTEKQIALHFPGREHGGRSAKPFVSMARVVEPKGQRLILPISAADEILAENDYIELRPPRKKQRRSQSPESEAQNVDYRSIEGKAKPVLRPEDEDIEYTTGSDDGEAEDSADRAGRQRNAALNRKAKDDPTNVDAWLALIGHQAEIVLPGHDLSTLRWSQRRTLADLRIAIYDRALRLVNKSSLRHDDLVLGRLEEGAILWESSKLAAQWSETLKQNPLSISIWTNYLDFVQTDHIHFRYEKCKEAYLECFSMLRNAQADANPEHFAKVLSAQVCLLLRFTSFIRDAGYDELAHAIWQIVLEYQFFKPPGLPSSTELLESLEAFWESDVPRIGEGGSRGWNLFQLDASHSSRTSNLILKEPQGTDAVRDSFAGRESTAMGMFHLPATMDDDSDDPFRSVMFEDLRGVVTSLLNDLPKLEVINAFLCFMQLPPLRTRAMTSTHQSFWTDPFLCQPAHNLSSKQPDSYVQLSDGARTKHCKDTPFLLFHRAFNNVQRWVDIGAENKSAALLFVDQVLQRLITVNDEDDELAEYYLAFALAIYPKKAVKSAKRLLKLRPSSLKLYNAYALIEVELSHVHKAESVWTTALQMSSAWPEQQQKETILLIHSRTLELIKNGQDKTALRYLVDPSTNLSATLLAGQRTISAAERLKVTQILGDAFERMRGNGLMEHAALYVDCLAWVSYLVDDRNLAGALAIYEKYIAKLSGTPEHVALELVHQARAELLRIHIEAKRPYKPIFVRNLLVESLRCFPNNSLFYEVQTLISPQTRLDDHLRDAIQSNTERRPEIGVVGWCYNIARTVERCNVDGSGATVNSVRALFSKAFLVSDGEVRHSPYLWTLWLEFEQALAGEPRDKQRLRQVFYDGLRYLPWYKPWIILGMKYLPTDLEADDNEKQRMYDVITEREMRVRQEYS